MGLVFSSRAVCILAGYTYLNLSRLKSHSVSKQAVRHPSWFMKVSCFRLHLCCDWGCTNTLNMKCFLHWATRSKPRPADWCFLTLFWENKRQYYQHHSSISRTTTIYLEFTAFQLLVLLLQLLSWLYCPKINKTQKIINCSFPLY